METKSLHEENGCKRCGKTKLKSSSFCPHCGYVHEETFIDRIRDFFSGFQKEEKKTPVTRSGYYSVILTLLVSIYFFYEAITKRSLFSLAPAIFTLIYAIKGWLTERKKHEDSAHQDLPGHVKPEAEVRDDVLSQLFFCEECGAEIGEHDERCKKCGMQFG